jgi:hypothetical protein
MDMIGPVRNFPLLLTRARRQAGRWNLPKLVAWAPNGQSALFQALAGKSRPLDVSIPTNTWSQGPLPEDLGSCWWLSMGDTDFL